MVKYFCDVDSGIKISMSFMSSSSYQVHHNSPLKYCTALPWIISLHPSNEEEEDEQWVSKSLQLRWPFGHCPGNRAPFSSLGGISGWIYEQWTAGVGLDPVVLFQLRVFYNWIIFSLLSFANPSLLSAALSMLFVKCGGELGLCSCQFMEKVVRMGEHCPTSALCTWHCWDCGGLQLRGSDNIKRL